MVTNISKTGHSLPSGNETEEEDNGVIFKTNPGDMESGEGKWDKFSYKFYQI